MPRKPTGRPPGRPRKTVPAPAQTAVEPSTDLCGECWPLGWVSVHSDHDAVACVHGHYDRSATAEPDEDEDLEDEGDELDEDDEDSEDED